MSASVASTPGPPALVRIGQVVALGQRLLAQDLGEVEEVADAVGTQHAGAAEGRVEDLVGAGQRAGVRSGGTRGFLGAAGLHHDDRLLQRHLADGRQERARVAHGLHVDDDGVGVGVVAEVVDEVAPADVGHGAERDDGAEADTLAQAPVEDGGDERAATDR